MTKKHFIAIGNMISEVDDIDTRVKLANWFCGWFSLYSKDFDDKKFLQVCKIYHYKIEKPCRQCERLGLYANGQNCPYRGH